MNNASDSLLLDVNDKIWVLRSLIRIIDTGEALDFTASGLGVDAALVGLLGVFERRGDVDEEEGSGSLDGVARHLSALLVGSDGGGDDGGTGLGEFRGNEGDALDVLVAIVAGEAEFGRELVADGVTEQERDWSPTLLVEGDLQGACDGRLAAVQVACEEDGETLRRARWVGFAEHLDDLGIGEPFWDLAAAAKTSSELGSADVQSLGAGGDLVIGLVLVGVWKIGELLELDDFDSELVLVFLNGVLGVVWSVEFLSLGVLAGAGVVTTDDEVGCAVILTDDGVPDGFSWTAHSHGEREETESGHTVGVSGQESLVDTNTSEVVNITRLGQADDGMDQHIGLTSTGGANSEFTMGSVHGVSTKISTQCPCRIRE